MVNETVARFEKEQESWFATDPHAAVFASMGDAHAAAGHQHVEPEDSAAEFAVDGTREAQPQASAEWDTYYNAAGVSRETIGEDPRTPRERLAEVFP